MNIDVVREAINFPHVKTGDRLVIERVGAYNMTQWMQFITLRPRVVMIGTDGKPYVVRDGETIENIISMERVPDHLKKFEL